MELPFLLYDNFRMEGNTEFSSQSSTSLAMLANKNLLVNSAGQLRPTIASHWTFNNGDHITSPHFNKKYFVTLQSICPEISTENNAVYYSHQEKT